MRRRDFLLGSTAALGLAGCGRTAVPRPPSPVNITRAAAYSQDIYDTMRRVLAEHKLNVRGRRVVLKPNLVEFEPESAINTHPMLVHATLEAFRELGAAVAIAEGPGHRRSTLDLAAAAGYFPPALALLAAYGARERLAGLHAQDEDAPLGGRHAFDEEPVRHSPRRSLRLAQECAALGRHPPEHCGPALAVSESLRDCGWDRGDGRERTDSGAAQAAGVIVSGHDPVAVDATCCRIMQIEPSRIEYLTLAGGLEGIAEENIQQIGEKPDSVETLFDLIMELRELRRARA